MEGSARYEHVLRNSTVADLRKGRLVHGNWLYFNHVCIQLSMVHEVNRQASQPYTEVGIERKELLEEAITREGGKAVMELKKLG